MSEQPKSDQSLVVEALVEAAKYLRERAQEQETYGFFPGGDPRAFAPDREVCTPEELAAHEAACAAWERGECPTIPSGCGVVALYDEKTGEAAGTALFASGGSLGLGTYVIRNPEAVRALALVESALGSLGVSP